MALVKFYRGNKAKYDATKFVDGIYFSLDTKEIIINGISFGYNAAIAAAKTEVVAKSTGHVTVTVAAQTDGHSKVTVTENDIASAADLTAATERITTLETELTGTKEALAALTAELEWYEAE